MVNAEKLRARLEVLSAKKRDQIQHNDFRFWGLQNDDEIANDVRELFHTSILTASSYYGTTKLHYTVMGNIVSAGNLGSGGGWHQDSRLKKQYKAFCYLTNVLVDGKGAFEYLTLTDTLKVKLLEALTGNIGNRISDRFISNKLGVNPRKELQAAGDVFDMDTRLIHRGSPITIHDHKRYCLTLYVYGKNKPSDLDLDDINTLNMI